jgi:hypothetical protein
MATVFSAQRANALADPSVNNKVNDFAGRVRIARGTFTAAALPENDIIEMFVLPGGARLLKGELAHAALGANTTLAVGYGAHKNSLGAAVTAAPAAYRAAAASTAAQKVAVLATLALGSGSEVNANEDGMPVTVTLGGAAGTGAIELTIYYVVD